jgi:hypothetical protein
MDNNRQYGVWLAADKYGEKIFDQKPIRDTLSNIWKGYDQWESPVIDLPPGAIQAMTGRTLTWEDEAIEWKPNSHQP